MSQLSLTLGPRVMPQTESTDLLDIMFSAPCAPMPPKPIGPVNRWFYRCLDCLSVIAVEQELKPFHWERGIYQVGRCGACNAWLESMGCVDRGRLVRDEVRSACDDRCTSARGPNCDCKCHGKNHGSGLVVTVQVDAGGIPVAQVSASAKYRAEQFRELCATWEREHAKVYGAVIAAKSAGQYVRSFDGYLTGTRLRREYYKARGLAVYSMRQKKIQAMIDGLKRTMPICL